MFVGNVFPCRFGLWGVILVVVRSRLLMAASSR